jgi:transposase
MLVKVTKSGPRRYVQLVEAYRDLHGAPKQRTVATLGRLDQLNDSALDSVIAGLLRVTGRTAPQPVAPPKIEFESAREFGNVWALTELWNSLGFDRLRPLFRRTRHAIDVEALVRVMVFNRLCDPDSKLDVLRWLDTVCMPELDGLEVEHQHLLRAMDALVDQQEAVDQVLSGLLRPLIDQDLAVVFYDMTTIRTEGLSEQDEDLRRFGMSKEGVIARQVMLGVVQTAEGLPLYHEVFEGNTAEVSTLKPTIQKILARYPVKRVIAVADRGSLSIDNLQELQAIKLPGGAPLEFILAVPGRRYSEFLDLLAPLQEHYQQAQDEVLAQVPWNELRLVVAHDPKAAAQASAKRDAQIQTLQEQALRWVGKLEDQDRGKTARGRKLSDGSARARFYHEVCEAHLGRIVRVDLKSELFSYSIDEAALEHARMMDGKLLLVTNTGDLSNAEVVRRYKALADIERGFRVLKSEIEIGPVYHRLPQRIRAHAAICFMALILHRVMRTRLKVGQTPLSPEKALNKLRRIQHLKVVLNESAPISGLSSITQEHQNILAALNIKKPGLHDTQLKLL